MTKFITLATAALLASSSLALAQTTSPAPVPKPSSPTTAPTTPPAAKPDSSTSTSPSATVTGQARDVILSTEQANSWVGKPIYSSDGKNLGEVAAFAREANGRVTELHGDLGGFLGIGERRVRIMPAQFGIGSDRIVLNMTSEQAKSLPQIAKK